MRLHVVGLLVVAATLSGCFRGDTTTGPGPVAHPGVTLTPLVLGGQPWNVAVSRQGTVYVTQLATASIAHVAVDSDRVAATITVGKGPYDLTFNAAGSSAYVTNLYDHTVGVINTSTRTQTSTYPVAGGAVRALLGPAETKLYVTLDNGGLVVLNPTTGVVATTIPLGSVPLNGLALTSDKSRLYVSSIGGSVTEINTAADTVMRSFTLGGRPQDLVVGPGDSTLYAANEAGWVQVWNLKTWTRADSIAVPAAFGLALTPDGKQLWVTETEVGQIAVVDCASRAVVETILVLGAPRHLAITPDGTAAVVANQAGVVQIIR